MFHSFTTSKPQSRHSLDKDFGYYPIILITSKKLDSNYLLVNHFARKVCSFLGHWLCWISKVGFFWTVDSVNSNTNGIFRQFSIVLASESQGREWIVSAMKWYGKARLNLASDKSEQPKWQALRETHLIRKVSPSTTFSTRP